MITYIKYYIHDVNLCINDLLISRLEEKEKERIWLVPTNGIKGQTLG
jgi:hypothetical protein